MNSTCIYHSASATLDSFFDNSIVRDASNVRLEETTHQVTFTRYTANNSVLSKRFHLEDSVIRKEAAANLHSGTAERVCVSFEKFALSIRSPANNVAYGYGTYGDSFDNCVSITTAGNENHRANLLARTKSNFSFKNIPSVLLLDYDPCEYGPCLNHEQLLEKLERILPAFSKVAYVVKGSTSSGVVIKGCQPPANTGFHLYIPVLNARDIPRFSNVIYHKLFISDGYIALAKNGGKLIRTLIDNAVFSPERIDFIGNPILEDDGLEFIPPLFKYQDGDFLDTSLLPNLSQEELLQFDDLVFQKKAAITDQSNSLKQTWTATRVDELVDNGISREVANKQIERIINSQSNELFGDFMLHFSNSQLGAVSVNDVLANPSQYDKQSLADPVEGVAYGATTAMFFWNDGKQPLINSHAHGGQTFKLFVYEENLPTVVNTTDTSTFAGFQGEMSNGKYLATLNNIVNALNESDVTGYYIGFDEFSQQLMMHSGDGNWMRFTDNDYTKLRLRLAELNFKEISKDMMRDAVIHIANNNKFDSAKVWINGLSWDGIHRIERFLIDYFDTTDSEYAIAVSMYMWTALAARILQPGCKADMTPIFVGEQGCGKSTGIAALVPDSEFFCEISFDDTDDNNTRKMRGTLAVEISELRGLGTRNGDHIKAFLTRAIDELVEKYKEFKSRYARRCVFFGTTNNDQFLQDHTGNRRYLPIKVGKVNVAGIKSIHPQLWAEAAELFRETGIQWENAQVLAQAEVGQYETVEPWESVIAEWLNDPYSPNINPTTDEILQSCLKIEPARWTKSDKSKVQNIMRKLGYQSLQRSVKGLLKSRWYKKQ